MRKVNAGSPASSPQAGVFVIDTGYLRPRYDAIYLIIENNRAAIIDSGVNTSVPRVLAALKEHNIAPAQVDYVMLTHVHLDHAGGAGLLMSQLPNAKLAVHPRGARHMIDPSKLIEGATAVYGADNMRKLYGDILPIPAERVIETPDNATRSLGSRRFVFMETPGHARHHVCIYDEQSRGVFAGDTFGLSLRELDDDKRQYVFPTTTPVQFDPEALHASIERIVALKPSHVYVTHYGAVRDVARCADDMHRLIDAHVMIAKSAGNDVEALNAGLTELLLSESRRYAWDQTPAQLMSLFESDIRLNAQGLMVWLERQTINL